MTPSFQAACPASRLEHGTLSLNRQDVRCGITGLLRDAEGSPCVQSFGEVCYIKCPIWRQERERLWANKKPNRARRMINAGTGQWDEAA